MNREIAALVKVGPAGIVQSNKSGIMNPGGLVFLEAEAVARTAVEVASEKQASNIVMLDVEQVCSFTDYFVICNGETRRHLEAIWQGIIDELKKCGVVSHHSEGSSDSGWMLADFGSVIVHIFAPGERDYYQLDRLWDRAIPVLTIQ